MDVLGLTWLGVRTERFQEMAAMYRDVFGLVPVLEEAGFLVFSLPDGGTIELFGPDYPHNRHFAGAPVAGFLVPDVASARAEMERTGIAFLHEGRSGDGRYAWAHFRAPDGNLYEIAHRKGEG